RSLMGMSRPIARLGPQSRTREFRRNPGSSHPDAHASSVTSTLICKYFRVIMSLPGSSLPVFFASGTVATERHEERFEAAPDRFPARFTVGLATEKATQAGHRSQKIADGIQWSRISKHFFQHFQPFGRDEVSGRCLWSRARNVA